MLHPVKQLALTLVSVLCALTTAAAQSGTPSVLEVNGTFHVGELGTIIPNPGTPSATEAIWARRGQAVLRPDLTFSLTSTRHEAYPNGTYTTGPDNGSGTYTVTPDARAVLDFAPAFPGTLVRELGINPDATMLVSMRRSEQIESIVGVALRTSSGQSNASLNGRYHLFENRFGYDVSGLITDSVKGTIVFDGAGGWTFTGEEQTVTAAGVSSVSPVSDNGPYTVAADGAVSIDALTRGAISPNGDVLFMVSYDPTTADEVALLVGMRIGASYDMNALAGDWKFSNHELELGTQNWNPLAYTEAGDFLLDAQSSTTGTFSVESFWCESDPTGTASGNDTAVGTGVLMPDGIVQFTSLAGSFEISFAAGGDLFATAHHQGVTGMVVGLRTSVGSGAYGTATAGSGGIAPAAGMRGFPILGNQGFALRVVGGLGRAAAVLPISLAPSSGLPIFGGTLWFDLNGMIVAPSLAMSGPAGQAGAGEATMPLAVPNLSNLAGGSLYVQAIVLDPGAPGGLAMSDGFRVRFAR